MPQNWWEMYPEIQPSPVARRRLLPGPGGVIPGQPVAGIGADQVPPDPFDSSYFSGRGPAGSDLPSRALAGDDRRPAIGRDSAIQHAVFAIQRGADPQAVRARLRQMGLGDAGLDPPSPFSDLVPSGLQEPLDSYAPGQLSTALRESGPTPMLRQTASTPHSSSSTFADQMPTMDAIGKRAGDSKSAFIAAAFQPDDPPQDPFTHMMAADERGVVQPDYTRSQKNIGVSSAGFGATVRPSSTARSGRSAEKIRFGLNGYGYSPQPGDASLLARLIYSESGITPGDMLAIGWAAVNRVGFRNNGRLAFGTNLADVVSQRAANGLYAYSFLNDGGSPAWQRSANPSTIPDPAVWARSVSIANAILSGRAPDPSGGAQYFFASPDYDGTPGSARPGFPSMLRGHRIAPTPYQSASTATDHGRLTRNYFFSENPEKLWAPDPPRRGRRGR